MKVLLLGGDGFCGWPAALRLSMSGHQVVIVDDGSRRWIDDELGTGSLTPIRSLQERVAAWRRVSDREMRVEMFTVGADHDRLLSLLVDERPDAVVHFAEQRSAPYSMSTVDRRRSTMSRNLAATFDVCNAIAHSGLDIHLVHLGTMGVYGYTDNGLTLPEGYLDVVASTPAGDRPLRILYPADPGSIYHLTKAQDQLAFQYFNRCEGLRVTDLHQGVVWGVQTPETGLDPALANRFDYDGFYGTVLNRFVVQAVLGLPLTVHGRGGQTRAFIHLRDSVAAVLAAVEDPPSPGEPVRIVNQATETHRVADLAHTVSRLTGARVQHLANPRREDEEHDFQLHNDRLLAWGVKPVALDEGELNEVAALARRHAGRADLGQIVSPARWSATCGAETPRADLAS